MSEDPPLDVEVGDHPDRWLIGVLRAVAAVTLLAFAAAVMPEKWIVDAAVALGFEPFPDSPLTFYLARNLSALYGFAGAALWIITLDFVRYRPLIWYFALGTMVFGLLQLVVDTQAGMPTWWTLGEGGSTFLGGAALAWLDTWQRSKRIVS